MLGGPLQQLLLIFQAGRWEKLQNLVDQQIWERGGWQGSGPSSKLVEKVGGQESASKESESVEQAGGECEEKSDEEYCWQQEEEEEKEGRVPTVFEELLRHGLVFCRGWRPDRWLSNLGWGEKVLGDTILAHPMHQVVAKWGGGSDRGGDRGN